MCITFELTPKTPWQTINKHVSWTELLDVSVFGSYKAPWARLQKILTLVCWLNIMGGNKSPWFFFFFTLWDFFVCIHNTTSPGCSFELLILSSSFFCLLLLSTNSLPRPVYIDPALVGALTFIEWACNTQPPHTDVLAIHMDLLPF